MCGSTNWPYREPPEAYGLCKHGVWAEAFCAECCSPDTHAAALSALIAGDADLIDGEPQ